jgi:hypothetical protein
VGLEFLSDVPPISTVKKPGALNDTLCYAFTNLASHGSEFPAPPRGYIVYTPA